MGRTGPWSKLLVCVYLLPSVYTQTSWGPLRSTGGGEVLPDLFSLVPLIEGLGLAQALTPPTLVVLLLEFGLSREKGEKKKGSETFQNAKHTKQKPQIWFPNRLNHSFGKLSRGLCLLIPAQMGKLLPIWWTRVSSWHLCRTVGWVLTVFLPYWGRVEDTVSVTSSKELSFLLLLVSASD